MFQLGQATRASVPDAAEHFHRAAAALQTGDIKTAAAEYEIGLRAAPMASDAHNNLGAIYLELGQYQNAVREFQTATSQQPSNLDYQFNLGFGLFHLDRCIDAFPHLALAAGSDAHTSDADYIAGLCSYHLSRWDDAVEKIQKSIGRTTGSPEKLYILIRAARKDHKPAVAMKAFGDLASKYPDSLFVHELLAEAYDLTSDSSAAEQEFARAIQLAPGEPGLNLDLGYLYWKENRFTEAAERFRRELALDPHSQVSLYYLGAIALKQGNAAEALSLFKHALGNGGEYREAWIGIGEASEALRDFPTAEQSFRKAILYFPDQVEPHYRLAQLLKKQNRLEEASKEFALVTQLHEKERARAAAIMSSSREVSTVPGGK
jgi:tetratricopeptide (TPR) repeat protein